MDSTDSPSGIQYDLFCLRLKTLKYFLSPIIAMLLNCKYFSSVPDLFVVVVTTGFLMMLFCFGAKGLLVIRFEVLVTVGFASLVGVCADRRVGMLMSTLLRRIIWGLRVICYSSLGVSFFFGLKRLPFI